MTRTIIAPGKIEHSLYAGQLEFVDTAAGDTVRAFSQTGREKLEGPVVTLGQPQCWNLAGLARETGQPLSAELALALRAADFYLLELACSFRPGKDSTVAFARLDVYLQPKTGSSVPIAFDLYPREIYNEITTNWKVGIAPSLNFSAFEGVKLEGKLGEMLTTISFRKLEPVVVGYGLLQPTCGWDFEAPKNMPLRGVKSGYLIVKKPHGAEAVRAILDIKAEVVTDHGHFSAKVTEKDKAHLALVTCSD